VVWRCDGAGDSVPAVLVFNLWLGVWVHCAAVWSVTCVLTDQLVGSGSWELVPVGGWLYHGIISCWYFPGDWYGG
jgi:hypothetical protein